MAGGRFSGSDDSAGLFEQRRVLAEPLDDDRASRKPGGDGPAGGFRVAHDDEPTVREQPAGDHRQHLHAGARGRVGADPKGRIQARGHFTTHPNMPTMDADQTLRAFARRSCQEVLHRNVKQSVGLSHPNGCVHLLAEPWAAEVGQDDYGVGGEDEGDRAIDGTSSRVVPWSGAPARGRGAYVRTCRAARRAGVARSRSAARRGDPSSDRGARSPLRRETGDAGTRPVAFSPQAQGCRMTQ